MLSLIFIIPFFIVLAFAAKGASLYGAKTIIIKISEELKKDSNIIDFLQQNQMLPGNNIFISFLTDLLLEW